MCRHAAAYAKINARTCRMRIFIIKLFPLASVRGEKRAAPGLTIPNRANVQTYKRICDRKGAISVRTHKHTFGVKYYTILIHNTSAAAPTNQSIFLSSREAPGRRTVRDHKMFGRVPAQKATYNIKLPE